MLSLPEKDILDRAAEEHQSKPLPPVPSAGPTDPVSPGSRPTGPVGPDPANQHNLERELNAIRVIDAAFEPMTRGERSRVIHWVMERFAINA